MKTLFGWTVAVVTLSAQPYWVATWTAGLAPPQSEAVMASKGLIFENQTLRQPIHTWLGGSAVRVRLSNSYGTKPVEIGAAHIARRRQAFNIEADSDRTLTFSGRPSVTIPPDATVLSDAVTLDVPPNSYLMISLFFPGVAMGAGIHYRAMTTIYIGAGDQTANTAFSQSSTNNVWLFLAGVDVARGDPNDAAIVAFGDSWTDGMGSTSSATSSRRWPDVLAQRLQDAGVNRSVVNLGIYGNRLLYDGPTVTWGTNALARFERETFGQPGVRYAIILEGMNDIELPGSISPQSESVTAEDVVAALTQIANRAHEVGLKIFTGTFLPAVGSDPNYTQDKELVRQAVNLWIRSGAVFDGFVDFDQVVRDPANPDRILPALDSGDHDHPNDAGYKAMAEAIPLWWFQ